MTMEQSLSSGSVINSDCSFHEVRDDMDDEAETMALFRPALPKPTFYEPQRLQESVPLLTRSDSRDGSWSPYLRDLHKLSFSFLFIFLAYSAAQNLESSVNKTQGLGSAALGVLYLSLTVSSFAAPVVVLWLGSKKALLLGLLGYWGFITANLLPSWFTLIPAAVFLGFTASVLWVAEGTYLTFIAKRHAAVCNISEASALGIFNGEFWSIFSFNQVLGNLVTLALLQAGNEDTSGESSSGIFRIFAAFLGSLTVGTTLICLLQPHSESNTLSITDDAVIPQQGLVKAYFALLADKRMLLLVVLLLYTGMQQAFIWGDFTNDIVTSTLGLSWVGGVMAGYGAADTLASFLAGRYSSGLSSITIILTGGAFCQILVLTLLLLRHMYHGKLFEVIIFLAAVIWGFGDATFNTQISAVLGILFPRDIEGAFAQWKIWQSTGTSAMFFASPYIDFTTKLYILFCALLLSMGLFFAQMLRSARA